MAQIGANIATLSIHKAGIAKTEQCLLVQMHFIKLARALFEHDFSFRMHYTIFKARQAVLQGLQWTCC
jgi:carotenoid cleavage dioxygenase-like enzyme